MAGRDRKDDFVRKWPFFFPVYFDDFTWRRPVNEERILLPIRQGFDVCNVGHNVKVAIVSYRLMRMIPLKFKR